MSRFAEKYRIKSTRLPNYDYSTPGNYFITLCTLHRNNFFGKIIDNKIELSKMGVIAQQCLIDIPKHFPEIKLLEFVVMPNHVHVLVNLSLPRLNSADTHKRYSRDVACNVSTDIKVIPEERRIYFSQISPKSSSIPTIIRSYKSAVTSLINPKTIFFAWQPSYYDEIITDPIRLNIIKQYIVNNPRNWQKDKLYR